MHLMVRILWIALVSSGLAIWLLKSRWVGTLWNFVLIGLVAMAVVLAVWLVIDWKKGRDLEKKIAQTREPPQRP